MRNILVYGDSLSWGIIPGTRSRFPRDQRWPGVMEAECTVRGAPVRVIEDCLNGRRTAWDDPEKPGRRGVDGIGQRIEVNSPLDLIIIFLGTNDFQSVHENRSRDSADGLRSLTREIRQAPVEPGMPVPEILLVVPPRIRDVSTLPLPKFKGAEEKMLGLSEAVRLVALEEQCHFFDAEAVVTTSAVDGVHLDEDQHRLLGVALAEAIRRILP